MCGWAHLALRLARLCLVSQEGTAQRRLAKVGGKEVHTLHVRVAEVGAEEQSPAELCAGHPRVVHVRKLHIHHLPRAPPLVVPPAVPLLQLRTPRTELTFSRSELTGKGKVNGLELRSIDSLLLGHLLGMHLRHLLPQAWQRAEAIDGLRLGGRRVALNAHQRALLHFGVAEAGTHYARPREACAAQVHARQVCILEVGAAQVGIPQACTAEVGAAQVDVREVSVGEIALEASPAQRGRSFEIGAGAKHLEVFAAHHDYGRLVAVGCCRCYCSRWHHRSCS